MHIKMPEKNIARDLTDIPKNKEIKIRKKCYSMCVTNADNHQWKQYEADINKNGQNVYCDLSGHCSMFKCNNI